MNREELKELLRQELEEHLYAHPSKHKGGFAHPGSQPHVKDAKLSLIHISEPTTP